MLSSIQKVLTMILVFSLVSCGGGGGSNVEGDEGGNGSEPPIVEDEVFTLSGSIFAAQSTVADSDTNDIETKPVSNNTIATAQPVPNPSSIGGYVNQIETGIEGNSRSRGDRDDYFKVSLRQGQEIFLSIAEFSNQSVDLDLFLYDTQGSLVEGSVGFTKFESIVVPFDGEYVVNVWAYKGASNYSVSIGLKQTANTVDLSNDGFRASAEFVPGEVIARLRPSVSTRSFRSLATHAGYNLRKKLGAIGEAQLFSIETVGTSRARSNVDSVSAKIRQGSNEDERAKLETLYAIKKLLTDDDVEYAHPNFIKHALLTPNDEFYPQQWHYPLINLPAAWDITVGSRDVIVAVIDSGVALTHIDLQGQFIGGYDFISDALSARDGDGIDNNPNDEGDLARSGSSSFHGTHVAGTISAASNNQLGTSGVSWETRIMPIRVLGVGGGRDFDVAQGILFAAGLPNASGTVPPRRADIINLSLGGPEQGTILANAINDARNAGVIIIAAAGNSGKNKKLFPAAQAGVVSVSAVDANRDLAPYSTFGNTIDVAAPGGDLSADIDGDGHPDGVFSSMVNDRGDSLVTYSQGTSMASPHIAGVAALMKAVNSNLSPAEFDVLLAAGELTQDIGEAGKDIQFGYGLIDARKAVSAAQGLADGGLTVQPPTLGVNPRSINLGTNRQQTSLIVANTGAGNISISSVSENASWLTISQDSQSSSGLGSYRVNVDRAGLEEGVYQENITFISDHNTVVIPVTMQVSTQQFSGDLGLIYAVLFDAETLEGVDQVSGLVQSGQYPFSFSDVAVGQYTLIVGTDMDNDGFICDDGEACGGYPTLSQVVELAVSGDRSGLDFVATFQASVPASQNASAGKNALSNSLLNGKGFKLLKK